MNSSFCRSLWSYKLTITATVALACLWHIGAQWLMDGYWRLDWRQILNPDWAIGTILAGAYATLATLYTNRKTNGKEKWWAILATYHPAIVLYWLGFLLSRILIHGDPVHTDYLKLLGAFLSYGTFSFLAPPLLLACWLSRTAIRKIHTHESRSAITGKQ